MKTGFSFRSVRYVRRTVQRFVLPAILLLSVFLSAGLSGCQRAAVPVTLTTFSLDTVCQITVYSEKDRKAASEVLSLLPKYENIFSRTLEGSELYRLNQRAGSEVTVSDDLFHVLQTGRAFAEASVGKFDITLGSVTSLYDFTGGAGKVPAAQELKEALVHTGYQHLSFPGDHRVLVDDPELVLDLGGIAKGYIADRLSEELKKKGVKSALISLGGNLAAVGLKPDGSPFLLGIRHPEKTASDVIKTIEASDVSLVTSGVYERSFIKDGQLYHHLLDSSTGKPVSNGLLSCSVLAPSSETADALSTLLFILGPEEGREFLENYPGVRCWYITEAMDIIEAGG
ncbi:MAG: FAD:protein FMN transferase [Lachnospiraceae bacterium]|nr:FAD:protein FMN transferase [Lachnospiraceae bacterium]